MRVEVTPPHGQGKLSVRTRTGYYAKGSSTASDNSTPRATPVPVASSQQTPTVSPKTDLNSFRMNNFLVIVLGNPCSIIILQKQWGGVAAPKILAVTTL